MLKKALAALMCGAVTISAFASCGKDLPVETSTTDGTAAGSNTGSSASSEPFVASDIANFTAPAVGDKIIVMDIKDYGTVKIRLFPEYASQGVENFIGLAEKGYYDGLTFHRVIKDFMIQGGDPLGNGTGGQSLWGGRFDGGTDPHLIHVTGALAYANSGSTDTDGSQFYIVTGTVPTEEDFEYYAQKGYSFTDEQKQMYLQYGGAPHLDGGYTVFGQVIEGLDVVFKVQETATDSSDMPLTSVVMESVKVEEYDGTACKFYRSDYDLDAIAAESESVPEADYEAAAAKATEYLDKLAEGDYEGAYDMFAADEIEFVNNAIFSYITSTDPTITQEDFDAKAGRDAIIAALKEELEAAKPEEGWTSSIDAEASYQYTVSEAGMLAGTLGTAPEAAVQYGQLGLKAVAEDDVYAFSPANGALVYMTDGEWQMSYAWQVLSILEDIFYGEAE